MPTIEFSTYNPQTIKDFKPVLAKSVTPEWWKRTKAHIDVYGRRVQSVRACPAMDDWLKTGWLLVSNRDIHVEHDGHTGFFTQQHGTYGSPSHPASQQAVAFEFLGEDGPVKDAFKMKNPWSITTPKGYSTFYLDPFLHQNRQFSTWQGIIDTDTFNKNMDNAQIIFYPKVNHSFTIYKGTPLCQIIPFKRETWNASYLLKDEQTYLEDRSLITAHHGEPDWPAMDEQNRRKGFSEAERTDSGQMGAYRKYGYWKEKSKLYKEDNPPPECPMHVSEEHPEVQLEMNFGDTNGS